MLGIKDYLIIGYLVILCLCAAYFRRNSENKLKTFLSYSFLLCASLSIIGYFILFYLIDNYEKYLIYYILISVVILVCSTVIILLKFRDGKKDKD